MPGRLSPLFDAPALWMLGGLALLILAVYNLGRDGRAGWAPVVLRVLAVLGLIIPGWTIRLWYQELARAREWSQQLPIETQPIADRFLVNSTALLTLGFFILVGGIYLARRAGRTRRALRSPTAA
ncbi:MAG: hypothetical protein ABR559_04270 [Gemmatimonadota bacterium]